MAGITHSPFRRLMRRHQSALVVSELISAYGIDYQNRKTLDLLSFHSEERPVGLQIFGEEEGVLCRAAQSIERLGADFVDLNLGCPVAKVVQKGGGAALCRDPVVLEKILKAMVKSVQIPVTIKIRTGWDQDTRNAKDVIAAAEQAGITWVAVHGRTRAQAYQGQADWDFIAGLKQGTSLPLLGNGDVTTPEVALKRYEESGVDAVMIGRGALRNPFLFEQAVALWQGKNYVLPRVEDFLTLLQELQDCLQDFFPPPLALLHARKFLAWYATGFPHCHDFRTRVFQIEEPTELWKEAVHFFEVHAVQRDFQFLSEDFLMGGHG